MEQSGGLISVEQLDELADMLARTPGKDRIKRILTELHTKTELSEMSKRYFIMKELARGVPQRRIASEMEVSLCNITRGSRVLKDPESEFRRHFSEMFDETHI